MKKLENKPMSMFSMETLDSIAMAEICGGATNKCTTNNCTSNNKPACTIVIVVNPKCTVK